MPDLVRIRDTKSKAEVTVGRQRADQLIERGGVEIVNDAATDRLGRAMPPSEPAKPTKTASKEPTQ